MQIMNKVDVLDLVEIRVYKTTPMPHDPAPIRITVDALEDGMHVIFDEDALNVLNSRISEEVIKRELDIRQPNTIGFIEELVGRMVSELHKHGLMIIEPMPDAPDDPYEKVRHQYDQYKN